MKNKLLYIHIPKTAGVYLSEYAEHCEKSLLPSYWMELDFVAEASDQTFAAFCKRYLHHDFQPGIAPAHASGSRGYHHYCAAGLISAETQRKVEHSVNLQIYQQIVCQYGRSHHG